MKYISKKEINLPKRKKEGKKGDNGRVLVIGGSKDYVGAPALAGLAAMRSGADWVTVAAPEKVAWAINALSHDIVTIKLKGDFLSSKNYNDVFGLLKRHNAVLIGNGIGLRKETKSFVKKIIKKIECKKVIDADAIKILSANDLSGSIITPHIKELEIFLQNSKIKNEKIKQIINEKNIQKKASLIKNSLKRFFEKDNVLLLKGPKAIIMSKEKTYLNDVGAIGMTKAGTGDVLAGMAAGFLAQSGNLLQSAVNSSYFSKEISRILSKRKKGFTFLASDMVAEIKRIAR